ncbi:DeoR/GlpR family DNA-binding transcription regulator [Subtercola boreus]|uniref:DeoR family transcriptional regulator n=1 Tax=Subtercola boreus TaxID=120213 RepID=A0A3E0WAA6_9MICO|nr:DeoR/GlpR family DNA-binding transcription regulator [Subtercola boreus]RFA20824.1 DeoR family transcriptional regulator [Subtercola boreus]RFA20939.1 DeoR family transcriptional regulator [Subtercola boreus]RFA27132.1 DeoR family transcriptional regulator [Subtercola boreus]
MAEPNVARQTKAARQRKIVDHLGSVSSATAAELADLTGVSPMTVHRDIDDLARRGILRKFHGGVSVLPTTVFESSSEFRMQTRSSAKNALAREALKMVEPGMSMLLDDSTTVLALARLLGDVGPLTVITNYRQAIEELRENEDIRLIITGGQYSRTHDSFIGIPDQSSAEPYAVDIVFQSTSTMGTEMTYHQEQDIVLMKRAMLRSGTRRVLMMDSSKVGRTSLNRYVPVSEFTDVILTDDVDPSIVAQLAEKTVVHLATSRP